MGFSSKVKENHERVPKQRIACDGGRSSEKLSHSRCTILWNHWHLTVE